jgi:hypothetical protein
MVEQMTNAYRGRRVEGGEERGQSATKAKKESNEVK